ncbi:MAG: thiamine diphosphokinase [Christensenellaceae bacterium]|jgi:thiamine pyrophosphokinase|nr:thiamine diphosphokinase [Christensenellaceae bacterium]
MITKDKKAVLILSGEFQDADIPTDCFVICADNGIRFLPDGIVADVLLGDFDSLRSEELLAFAEKVLTYPTDKDMTDGELCLHYLADNGFTTVEIYGALGGRTDHLLGNLSLIALASSLGITAKIITAMEEVSFLNPGKFEFAVPNPSWISLVAFDGDINFTASSGLKYNLAGLIVSPYETIGISNENIAKTASVTVGSGSGFLIVTKKLKGL